MFRGLIDYLTFGYTFICKGRGKLKPSEMMMIQGGADVAVRHAEEVLAEGQQLTKDDKMDLARMLADGSSDGGSTIHQAIAIADGLRKAAEIDKEYTKTKHAREIADMLMAR